MRDRGTNADAGVSRRTALKGIGAGVASLSLVGTASADSGETVNVVEAGADDTGDEPIDDVLDGIDFSRVSTVYFPSGRYRMDEVFRLTGFSDVAFVGDDATIFPGSDIRWLFKLGVESNPGDGLRFEGFTFDFTDDETGLRALQVQVRDDLLVRDVTVEGRHDSGELGPFLFDVLSSDGIGSVENVRAPDGGAFSVDTPGDIPIGPTGIIVTGAHEGKLWFRDCVVESFPDNGLYTATNGGRIIVQGGTYRNNNISNVRLSGDYSYIRGATVVVDENRSNDVNQTGVRLDSGKYLWVYDTEIRLEKPNGPALNVLSEAEWSRVQESKIVVRGDESNKAVRLTHGAGKFDLIDSEVVFDAPGTALHFSGPSSADADPVWVLRTDVTGEGDGSHGRHVVRAERGNSTFDRLDVTQTGGNYRRAIKVLGDGCELIWGDYSTAHIPIVDAGTGTKMHGVWSRSRDDYEGLKLTSESDGVVVEESAIYGGIRDDGASDVTLSDNVYPDP